MIKHLVLSAIFMGSQLAFGGVYPVPQFDLESYQGQWFEIASTKPFFQKNCVCVTANYSLNPDDTVKVVNSCRDTTQTGPLDIVEGIAKKTPIPGVLKVNFGFPALFPNYIVVDLADDYSYAAVSGPFRDPIWILSRTSTLSEETLEEIKARLQSKGFDPSRLSPTLQEGCAKPETLFEIVEGNPSFQILRQAVAAAGLSEVLSSPGPFTVLAPTDEAFAALGDEVISDLLQKPEVLKDILLYHVVLDVAADSKKVQGATTLTMANGDSVTIDFGDSGLFINESQVIQADIGATNGIVHVIDQVLLPPAKN